MKRIDISTWPACALGVVMLAGCSSVAIVDPLKNDGRITTTAAHALFSDEYTPLDLIASLDPEKKRSRGGCTPAAPSNADDAGAKDDFGAAMRAFYCYPDAELRRNRLQDELLWRSENRCNLYKNYLKRVESTQSTYTGILSTILGGVGAITKDLGRAQLHSALASITSGVGAELRQGFFSDVAVSVLVPGIDEKRRQLLLAIQKKRDSSALNETNGGPSINNYTMESALRDVAEYHGACSILVGLDFAKDAIREIKNPGMQSMAHAFAAQRFIAKVADPKSTMQDIETARVQLANFSATTTGLIGISRTYSQLGDAGSATGYWSQSLGASTAAIAVLETRIAQLGADSGLAAATKPELEKLGKTAGVKDAAGAAQGCGTGWLRGRVNEEFSSALSGVADKDKNILAARQKVQLAAGDGAARIREQAVLEQAQEDAAGDVTKVKRYAQLIADAAKKIGDKLAAEAKTITNPIVYGVAKDIQGMGQIQLSDGKAAGTAKACP